MKPIFAVKDRGVNSYNDPFAHPSQQTAIRQFKDEVNSDPERSIVARHPDDFDLYQLGEYNEETGYITPEEGPQLIARGKDLINPKGA